MATYVLIHGGGHGGWCYQKVARLLQAAGHVVYAPSLTGCGDRSHLVSADTDLDTHITDVVSLLHHEDLHEVILVGHSYGGMVITGVADRATDRIGRIVYLDAANPRNGQSLVDVAGPHMQLARDHGEVDSCEQRSWTVQLTDSPDAPATAEHAEANDAAEPAIRIKSSPAPATPVKPINRASYGHDPGYAWLKGRLEYSNIDRRWKLRYIPIDGQTDSHGGSVMLSESSLLAGFASGDFIAVQGALGGRTSNAFAPEYELTRVKRLEQ